MQELKERLLWTTLSAQYSSAVMISEFFIVSVETFTTLDVVTDVLTLASDVVFLTVLKMHPDFTGCEKCILNFLFMSYSLHVTFKRSFSHVRKRNFWATKFASKGGFVVIVSLQPWFILFFLQKQPQEVFCKNRCSLKFRKFHRKTSVLESLFQ